MQFFFINGRAFHSATMQAALEQAYRNTLLTGRFPACVLYITLGFGKVDVNVHPTKREVKFSEEKKVFDAVYGAVRAALEEHDGQNTAEIRSPLHRARRKAKPRVLQDHDRAEYRESGIAEKAERQQRAHSDAQSASTSKAPPRR
jgi:DNA mismatch repair protein MutL